MPRNRKLGNQTARKGVMAPLTENDVDKVENMMYKELKAKPIPKCKPIPPLTFLEARETPINVIINAANGMEYR
ncbi:hypothetical protein SDC9_205786 [bioreactor metagenome]|uniref:Uncharacterized protein n=1 Tax=bioreactor metagenome TaxID=1076179 RepID=A0A645J2Z4_9ZZZZ